MATPDLTASQVMAAVNSLMNDQGVQQYSEAVQIPYLNMALQELQEEFELAEIPVVATVSAVINVPLNSTRIAFAPAAAPNLPADMVEPSVVWQSFEGQNQYVPMSRVAVLPRWAEGQDYNQFLCYTWQSQEIRFLPCNQDNDIKIDFIKQLFAEITDGDDDINVINSKGFLYFKTAALLSYFVEENDDRGQKLDVKAAQSLDRISGIGTKGRQATLTRRRPFRQGYQQGFQVR